ncbi:MAG: acyl-CoA dehydrogenase family protein [Alphaproteobacteria bacterium]
MEISKTEARLVEIATAFAAEHVAPNAAEWERARIFPRQTFAAAAEAGLCGLMVPTALGGQGAGIGATARIVEALAAADFGFTFSLVVHNNLAGNVARNGSVDQKARYLPDLLAGRKIGAFLLTEPGAGSDAAAIATGARRDGNDWLIDGEKAWVTNAGVADVLSVYVQSDPEAGWRGIACLLVDADTPGVARTEPYDLIGGHAMGVGGITFEGCRVGGEASFIGPGEAFKAAMGGIDIARTLVGSICCGMMSASLDAALAHAGTRRAFGRKTIEFQGLQWLLADVATDLEAMRLLTDRALERLAGGQDAAVAAAHAKKFSTRAALAGIANCMQAMGAAGARAEYPLGRHLAAAKLAAFIDGTTEIQNLVIGRSLLARAGADKSASR